MGFIIFNVIAALICLGGLYLATRETAKPGDSTNNQ